MLDLTMVPWGSGVLWTAGIVLKGAAVLLIALLVAAALRRASAGLRHLVWSAGIVAVLVLPVVPLFVPWQWPVISVALPDAAPRSAAPASGAEAFRQESGGLRDTAAVPVSHSSVEGAWTRSGSLWVAGLFALWGAGVVALLVRLGLGAVLLRRTVRRATPLDTPDWTHPLMEGADRLGLDRLPRLLASDRVPMPVVCGLFDAAIVVPADAHSWTDRRRRAVLCHELAHLRRHDLSLNLLGWLACALHWFNPLVWLAARRLRVESERACDDLVLGVGTRPSEYADHLLQIVCGAQRGLAPAVAIPMAQRREFEGRMLAILERDARRAPPSRRATAGLAVLGLLLLLPIAAAAPTPATAPETAALRPGRGLRLQPAPARQTGAAVSPRVVAALLDALGGTEAEQRHDAASALGTLRARSAAGALSLRLRADPEPAVRETAAWALGQIGSPEALAPLTVAAQKDAAEEVRSMAAWALGQIADPDALPALEVALQDASVEVRARAAWALGVIMPARAPAVLIRALADTAPQVREVAAWALGQIRDPAATTALAAVPPDEHSKASYEALWALARIGGAAARPYLQDALAHQSADSKLRRWITGALAGQEVEARPRSWPIPAVR